MKSRRFLALALVLAVTLAGCGEAMPIEPPEERPLAPTPRPIVTPEPPDEAHLEPLDPDVLVALGYSGTYTRQRERTLTRVASLVVWADGLVVADLEH